MPDEFFTAYVKSALWSSTDDDDNPLDAEYGRVDVHPDTLAKMRADCERFYAANQADLECDGVRFGPDYGQVGRAGHDFWLTRNGHGAGFWDGDWPDAEGERLTAASKKYGEVNLYVGDDGKIYA